MSESIVAFNSLAVAGRRSSEEEAPITKCPGPNVVSMSICHLNTTVLARLCPDLASLTVTGKQREHLGAGYRYTG